MTQDSQKVCFVVMGFGKKTDYPSGRTLDLDATFEAIIKPAVDSSNLRCIRSDQIKHSGIIDTEMYEMLLNADLVIADISTGNANAVYELGVRHALRPNSTIIMKEEDGQLYFDLNHSNTFKYQHLGPDIGNREATRAKSDLINLITEVLNFSKPDSPVYTYLPTLKQPTLTTKEYEEILIRTEDHSTNLASYIKSGDDALDDGRFEDAVRDFKSAEKIALGEPYVIQKLALATYKCEKPTKYEALISGLMIVETLNPWISTDPETLGIAGAIRKRLWQETNEKSQLDGAINLYRRGYEIRQDYYNGENLALCLGLRATIQSEDNEALYDRMSAKKVRESLLNVLSKIVSSADFDDRSDKKWVYATYANCMFYLGCDDDGSSFEKLFYDESPSDWEIATYEEGKQLMYSLLGEKPA